MLAGAQGAPVTPGTAAVPSLPWNHKVLVSHHLRSVIKAKTLWLKDGIWGTGGGLSKKVDPQRELGWGQLGNTYHTRKRSDVSGELQTHAGYIPLPEILLERAALVITPAAAQGHFIFILCQWHLVVMYLGFFTFSYCHEGAAGHCGGHLGFWETKRKTDPRKDIQVLIRRCLGGRGWGGRVARAHDPMLFRGSNAFKLRKEVTVSSCSFHHACWYRLVWDCWKEGS